MSHKFTSSVRTLPRVRNQPARVHVHALVLGDWEGDGAVFLCSVLANDVETRGRHVDRNFGGGLARRDSHVLEPIGQTAF